MKKIKFLYINKNTFVGKLRFFFSISNTKNVKNFRNEMVLLQNIKSNSSPKTKDLKIGEDEIDFNKIIKFNDKNIPIIPKNYYDAFGVSNKANLAEIKKRYIKIAKKFHPDKNIEYLEYFSYICCAYDVLKDDQKRAIYDEDLFLKENKPWIINLYFFNLNIIYFFLLSLSIFLISLNKKYIQKIIDKYYCPLGEYKYDITLIKENKYKTDLKEASIEELKEIIKKEKIAEDEEYEYYYVHEENQSQNQNSKINSLK